MVVVVVVVFWGGGGVGGRRGTTSDLMKIEETVQMQRPGTEEHLGVVTCPNLHTCMCDEGLVF